MKIESASLRREMNRLANDISRLMEKKELNLGSPAIIQRE
jgi:hypothetical protein